MQRINTYITYANIHGYLSDKDKFPEILHVQSVYQIDKTTLAVIFITGNNNKTLVIKLKKLRNFKESIFKYVYRKDTFDVYATSYCNFLSKFKQFSHNVFLGKYDIEQKDIADVYNECLHKALQLKYKPLIEGFSLNSEVEKKLQLKLISFFDILPSNYKSYMSKIREAYINCDYEKLIQLDEEIKGIKLLGHYSKFTASETINYAIQTLIYLNVPIQSNKVLMFALNLCEFKVRTDEKGNVEIEKGSRYYPCDINLTSLWLSVQIKQNVKSSL